MVRIEIDSDLYGKSKVPAHIIDQGISKLEAKRHLGEKRKGTKWLEPVNAYGNHLVFTCHKEEDDVVVAKRVVYQKGRRMKRVQGPKDRKKEKRKWK